MLQIRSAAPTLLALIVLAGTDRACAQERAHDVVYGPKFGIALTMDVWKPAKQNGSGVIFIVSGGFKSGIDLVDSGPFVPVVAKPYLDRGYTLFAVCHGAQPRFIASEIVPDIHRAVRFIRIHAKDHGVGPDRLGIMGGSSGGFLALSIGTAGKPGDQAAKDPVDQASSRVQAVACFNPACDLSDVAVGGHGSASRSILRTTKYRSPTMGYDGTLVLEFLPRTHQTSLLTDREKHLMSSAAAPRGVAKFRRRSSLQLDGDIRPGGTRPPTLDGRDITPVVGRNTAGRRSGQRRRNGRLAGVHVGPILPEKRRKPRQTRWNVTRIPAARQSGPFPHTRRGLFQRVKSS